MLPEHYSDAEELLLLKKRRTGVRHNESCGSGMILYRDASAWGLEELLIEAQKNDKVRVAGELRSL